MAKILICDVCGEDERKIPVEPVALKDGTSSPGLDKIEDNYAHHDLCLKCHLAIIKYVTRGSLDEAAMVQEIRRRAAVSKTMRESK